MMREALRLAREAASADEVPVGAVVWETASGIVLGTGRNRREEDNSPSAHAEFIAIEQACQAVGDWRLNHCSLAVTLEPCPMCAGLIVNARIGRVVFGALDPKAGACSSLFQLTTDPRLNHRVHLVSGVLADEAADMLKEFFQSRR
ncbi:MAG: tRNA-specific adenosine deaminase [Phycisphaera sp.]|nr:MAG: tRNA-specific adenosine deaminase [Phycisphaera sp.]